MPINKSGVALATLQDWKERAGPKGKDHHWVDGRSAKEFARAWIEAGPDHVPHEIQCLLSSHSDFGALKTWNAEPEVRLYFDDFQGEPRNTDLLLLPEHRRFIVAIEAKADEVFSETVADTLTAALERRLENARSNGIKRVEQLVEALFVKREGDAPRIGALRYQLLTACAGVLCEAEKTGCERALMVVHEFVTDESQDRLHERNARDLDAFIARVSRGLDSSIAAGEIRGPYTVPGRPLSISKERRLYIGKVRRDIRNRRRADRQL